MMFTLVLIVFGYYLYQLWDRRHRRLPPGPVYLPLLGNILQLIPRKDQLVVEKLNELCKTYGNVLYLQMGVVPLVIVSGYETLKSAWSRDEFLNRVDTDWYLHRSFNKKIGINASPKELWEPMRSFATRHLGEFGFGKSGSQQMFLDAEIQDLNFTINKAITDNKGIIQPTELFQIPTVNVVWASVAGKRFDHNDPKLKAVVKLAHKYFKIANMTGGPENAFPFLVKWFPRFFNYDRIYEIDNEMHEIFRGMVKEFREKGTYKTDPQCFLESFLQVLDSDGEKDTRIFNDENLITVLYDMFAGGSVPPASTLSYAIFYLAKYPEVQERMRKEIRDVVGRDIVPTIEDKPRLPYLRAVVLEVLRRSTIVPFSPRTVVKDTELNGYVIPSGSIVLGSLYNILMDEKYWGDPENFRPSRFLDSDNNLIHVDRVLNYGAGKRGCMSVGMSDNLILAILSQLVNQYEFLPIDGDLLEKQRPSGTVFYPSPFSVFVRKLSK